MHEYRYQLAVEKDHGLSEQAIQARNRSVALTKILDNRPESAHQKTLQNIVQNSPINRQLAVVQKLAKEFADSSASPIQKKENKTGLPNNLKEGIESLSGFSMNDVKVHYNSAKPAQLDAHAYAQGTDIHLATGQEKHLPHEAWHVAQQKQGRVKPTRQLEGGVSVNDDVSLEREADVMGNKAIQGKFIAKEHNTPQVTPPAIRKTSVLIQRALTLSPNSVPLDVAQAPKLADVIRIANAAHGLDAAVTGGNIDVLVEITSPERTDMSPAYTLPVVAKANGPGHDVTIEIQRAYFELATVGEILGMIAHELGVHGYNDALATAPLAGPRWAPVPSVRPRRAATGYVTGQQGRHTSDDHLDVAQAIVPHRVSAKANKYVETILFHGNAIQADAYLNAAEKQQAQGELISSYCFDIARIVATDDRMAFVPAHWDAIREIYRDTYTFLQTVPTLTATAWFAAAPLKPAAQLKPDFNSLIRRYAWQKLIGR